MTGKDLIIYILKNNLENEQVFKDGKLFNLPTVEQYAAEKGVGTAAVYVWIKLGMVEYLRLGDTMYVLT